MITAVKRSLLAIAISGVVASPAVNATNGYFSHGYSTKEKGLAGAGTAFSQDAMAAATNPAGMAFVGERMDVGMALFSPSPRGFTLTGTPVQSPPSLPPGPNTSVNAAPNTTYESDNDLFLIPHFAYNWQLNSDSTVGVSVYGNGGMDTEYPASATPGGFGTFGGNGVTSPPPTGNAGISMAQLFINVSFSKKIDAKNAVGGSVILVGQRFEGQGLENFGSFSVDPSNLSGNRRSDSFGAGVKLGYQGEVSDGVRVGIAYQSKMSMGEWGEYKGLFAEGGDFDIPSTYNIGVSFDVGSSGVIVADIQRINYSDVASISNPVSNLTNGSCLPGAPFPSGNPLATGSGCLGGSNGAGFGWEDMTIFKIGYQIDDGDNTYRVGYSHADQPIPDSETLFNLLAPAVIEDHITAGMTMKLSGNQEFNIAGMYAPNNTVKGPNPFDGGAAVGGTDIEIEMSQWEIQAGWAWKY